MHRGVALICSREGILRQVVRDELGLNHLQLGQPLSRLAAPGSGDKAERLLATILEHGASFGWELDLPRGQAFLTLSFAGSLHGDSVLLIGARLVGDIFELYEELARINNEEVNLLRRAIKDRVLVASRRGDAHELRPLEQLSQLNNELTNLQRELARKNSSLERLNAQKNTFLGMAAHDLRNPIANIMGYASLLLEVPLEQEQQRLALDSIVKVSEQMLALVNDLLDISVIESGRLELDCSHGSLAALVQQRVELSRLLASKKQIVLCCELDSETQTSLDSARMGQVVDNLVQNAIKFSPVGSEVRISVRRQPGELQLSVADQGPGLSPRDLQRLFGPFQRLSARPTGGEKSTGLGLAICKRIVVAHGGRIEAHNREAGGACFMVTLPLATAASGPEAGAGASADGNC